MTETKQLATHMQGKIIQTDYDFITSLDDDWCQYCLSQKHVQMILSIVDYFGWRTRWFSSSGTIDKQTIIDLQGGLVEALMNNCCNDTVPILYRVDPTNDLNIQISYDGGTTWINNPSNPVYGIPTLPAPVGTISDTKCDAAKNGSDHFNDLIAQQSAKFDTASTGIQFTLDLVAALLTAVFAPEALPILVPIFIASMTALLAFGKTAFDDYWNTDNKNIIFCALYQHIKSDGTFDDAAFNAFLSAIATALPASIAKDNMYRQLQYIGAKGLSALCSYGTASGSDCTACDNCPNYDFTTSDNGFIAFDPFFAGEIEGTYVPGTGWLDSYNPHGGAFNNMMGLKSPSIVGITCTGGTKIHINVIGYYSQPLNYYFEWQVSGHSYTSFHDFGGTGNFVLDFAGILPDPTSDKMVIKQNSQALDWYITRIEVY